MEQLGIRHINQIPLGRNETPATYLKIAPPALLALGLDQDSFFHQDTYKVPDYPYQVHWACTVQPRTDNFANEQALILDINVFTTPAIATDREALIQKRNDMRWIKNKIFFSCITQCALEQFGG